MEVRKLFRALFKKIESLSITNIDNILDRLSVKCGNDKEELYTQLCLEWFKTAPRHVRQVKQVIACLEEIGLNGLVYPMTVITPGARRRACKEIIRVIDGSDERNVVKKIGTFSKSLYGLTSKNMAIDLLLKL